MHRTLSTPRGREAGVGSCAYKCYNHQSVHMRRVMTDSGVRGYAYRVDVQSPHAASLVIDEGADARAE